MATASSAGAGSAMSNLNRGPRNMSAGDWIRLKRLQGAKGYGVTTITNFSNSGDVTKAIYPKDKDIGGNRGYNGTLTTPSPKNPSLMVPCDAVGVTKILRPASNWTDFIASQTADYITTGIGAVNTTSVTQTVNKVCNPNPTTITTIQKAVNPVVNQFARQKILS